MIENGPKGFRAKEVIRQMIDKLKPTESTKETLRMTGEGLYMMSRWVLASILHPVATFQATMLIGDKETRDRNAQRALSLPRLPIGRDRLRP